MRFQRIDSMDDLIDVLIRLGAFEEEPEMIDGQRQAAMQNEQAAQMAALSLPTKPHESTGAYAGDQVKNKNVGVRVVMHGDELQFPKGCKWQFRTVPLFGACLEVKQPDGEICAQIRVENVRHVTGPSTVIRAPQTPSGIGPVATACPSPY